MSRRPPMRAANFAPLAVKFITAPTGYRPTHPHGAPLYKTCVIYKLPYGIKGGRCRVIRGCRCESRCLVFLGVLLLSGNSSSPADGEGVKVENLLNEEENVGEKHLERDHRRATQNKRRSRRCDEESGPFNFIPITFLSALQTRID